MAESVPVRCPECQRTQAYAAPVFPCACGSPVAPPVTAGATAEPITHRNWTDEWVTVRCGACGREDDWPHPELGCACGTVLRVPVRSVDAEPGTEPGAGGGAEDSRAVGGRGHAPARTPAPQYPPAPRPPLTPPDPEGLFTGRTGRPSGHGGTAGGPDRSGPPSGTAWGTTPQADPRGGPGTAPRDPGGPGLAPPPATAGTFGGDRPDAAPVRPGTSGLDTGGPGAGGPGAGGPGADTFGTGGPGADGPGAGGFGAGGPGEGGAGAGGHGAGGPGSGPGAGEFDASGPGTGGPGEAGTGPGGPRAVEPGSEWFGTGPAGRDGQGSDALDVPPGSCGHRTFAERYPAHIPLPPTAPRPEPVRGAFRPVTIRTARDAVAAAAGYLRWLGFRDVVQPEDRPASGVDLRAPGLVAQVDPSTRPAGLRAVECLWLNGLSTPSTSVSVFFSLAGYTPEARERAAEIGLPLFVLDLTGTPQPVNHAADELAAAGA
ncbi:hypothetical protein [Streptomyces sp. NPDC015130]|uniref:hypothetical protein n=1 Tax=Streptomyces sp. NPDC015130 TaxID=3364940 RepID=UPI0036FC1CD0